MTTNFIAGRLSRIKPSPTMAMTRIADEKKAAGENVIGLAAGEPDFDTPSHICKASVDAMNAGKTKYTTVDGIPDLKDAVIAKFARDNNIAYERENITIATGGKQVLFNALMATVNDGDEVIIPAPYWVSYPEIVRVAEGVPVIISCAEEDDFKLTPEVLTAAITPHSKWLILNSPSNPTGATYSKDELIALADVVRAHPHLHVLCDDIYEYLIYDGAVFATMAEIAPDLIPRILIMNGVSKSYSMTGWRIGYAAGAVPLIKAMAKIQSQSTSNPNSIAQWAAVAALTGPRDFMAPQLAIFDERRSLVINRLNDIDGISCMKPAGAFYVYPSCAGLLGRATPEGVVLKTDSDVVTYFLESEGVAMVPGAAFGLSPYFRISYAAATDVLDDAMTRIARACAALR
jgi:aspartate aminotransferase